MHNSNNGTLTFTGECYFKITSNRLIRVSTYDEDGTWMENHDVYGEDEIHVLPALHGGKTIMALPNDSAVVYLTGTPIEKIDYIMGPMVDTDMVGLFKNCNKLTSVNVDIFKWNLEKEVLTDLFNGCESFDITTHYELIHSFIKITNLDRTFSNTALSAVTSEIFRSNTSDILNLFETFSYCRNLNIITTDVFDQLIRLTNLEGTFRGCSALTSVHKKMFSSTRGTLTKICSVFLETGITAVDRNFLSAFSVRARCMDVFGPEVIINDFH